jgi:hypothetical protein
MVLYIIVITRVNLIFLLFTHHRERGLLSDSSCLPECSFKIHFYQSSFYKMDDEPEWRTGYVWWGPICDQQSGPQQYFLTKLPTEIQVLGSRRAEIHLFSIFVNFALLHEVWLLLFILFFILIIL